MKNKLLYCWLLGLFGSFLIAQNQNNHWQLGATDLNFTTSTPVASVVSTANYGKASISDSNGNLLFYTNGYNVWNKNHNLMTNGGAIIEIALENYDFINTVIVPNPGNSNQYYIISSVNVSCLCFYLNPTRYYYSLVEFNASNPLGEVLAINSGGIGAYETMDAKVFPNIDNGLYFGPITVTRSQDNSFYWLILQNGSDIHSYRVDQNGLSLTPVVSNFTSSQVYQLGSYNPSNSVITGIEGADFKMIPKNTKMIGLQYSKWGGNNDPDGSNDPAYNFKNFFYMLDFNSQTGQFSNYQLLTGTGKAIYEFEISNNSNCLYYIRKRHPSANIAGPNVLDGEVVVKDLLNTSTPVRVLNEFVNSTTPTSGFSYIQKDKNNDILISSTFSSNSKNLYVHKINSQDDFLNSTVSINYVYLNGNTIHMLPPLIPIITGACPINLTITNNVTSGVDTKQASSSITASNTISNPASAIYHAGSYVLLTNGFKVTGGAKFRAYIEGCTGNYVARVSNNPDDESQFVSNSDLKNSFKIYPNPSNSMIIVSSEDFKMKQISISSLNDNRVILNQKIDNLESVEVDVTRFEKGIYIVSIESTTGEILTQKLIKN